MSLEHRDWVESGVLLNTRDGADNAFPHGTIEHCQAHGITLQAWGALAKGRFHRSAHVGGGRGHRPIGALTRRRERNHPRDDRALVASPSPGRDRPDHRHDEPAANRAPVATPFNVRPALSHDEWYQLWVQARGRELP